MKLARLPHRVLCPFDRKEGGGGADRIFFIRISRSTGQTFPYSTRLYTFFFANILVYLTQAQTLHCVSHHFFG
jgi:hypothetical protein